MARALVDLSTLDLEHEAVPEDELRTLIPHRHEFQLIDAICHLDVEGGLVVGVKRWDEDAWWGRGHIPGRPLMPGVLLAEAAAQAATVLMKRREEGWGGDRFIGLAGLDNVRFRGQISPPATVYFASRAGSRSGNRLARYPAQAICDGRICMDMQLLGALI